MTDCRQLNIPSTDGVDGQKVLHNPVIPEWSAVCWRQQDRAGKRSGQQSGGRHGGKLTDLLPGGMDELVAGATHNATSGAGS